MSLRYLIATLALVAAPSLALSPSVRVACIGDSLTSMSEGRGERGYGQHLEYKINGANHSVQVGVVAVNSTTSANHLTYWTTKVKAKGYTHLVLWSGFNDVDTGVAAATTQANIAQIQSEALAEGLVVVLVNVAPWSASATWNGTKQTNTIDLNAWTAARTGVTIIDTYALLGQSGTPTALATAYDSGDGLHINNAGAAILATTIQAALGF